MKITLEPYRPIDKNELIRVFKSLTPIYFGIHEEVDYSEYLDKFGHEYFTLRVDDQMAGGVGYSIRSETNSLHIAWILLHPQYFRLGLGRRLVEHCHQAVHDHEMITHFVARTSQHGFHFFNNMGYQLKEVTKNYWCEGIDLYYMEKNTQV